MSELFKIAEFFLKYFMGQGNFIGEKSMEISAEILNQLRRILILTVLTLGSLALFCLGMSYLIERLLNNLDNGAAIFTPSIWFIFGFQLICVGIMIYATNKNNWLDIFKMEKKNQVKAGSSFQGSQLESVISLLVLDFIKERESSRGMSQESSKEKNHDDNKYEG